jgi:HPt (histidine-containing phosphotransfer) domain-containing protein
LTDLPVLDPQPLHDLLDLGVEEVVIQELVELYRSDVPLRMTGLAEALAALDAEAAMQEAHQMKGALGNLGLLRMADLARRIEAQVKGGHWEDARALAQGLPTTYDEGLVALTAAFPKA